MAKLVSALSHLSEMHTTTAYVYMKFKRCYIYWCINNFGNSALHILDSGYVAQCIYM